MIREEEGGRSWIQQEESGRDESSKPSEGICERNYTERRYFERLGVLLTSSSSDDYFGLSSSEKASEDSFSLSKHFEGGEIILIEVVNNNGYGANVIMKDTGVAGSIRNSRISRGIAVIGRQRQVNFEDQPRVYPTDMTIGQQDIFLSRVHCKVDARFFFGYLSHHADPFEVAIAALGEDNHFAQVMTIDPVRRRLSRFLLQNNRPVYLVDAGSADGTRVLVDREEGMMLTTNKLFVIAAGVFRLKVEVINQGRLGEKEQDNFVHALIADGQKSIQVKGVEQEFIEAFRGTSSITEKNGEKITTKLVDQRQASLIEELLLRPHVKIVTSGQDVIADKQTIWLFGSRVTTSNSSFAFGSNKTADVRLKQSGLNEAEYCEISCQQVQIVLRKLRSTGGCLFIQSDVICAEVLDGRFGTEEEVLA